ncbi:MAG TPA: hypothetical protein VG253_04175, partial [Streptosporangiaceae bacterium]|nr:hypothetical protein [Streptosporangiaceae bacterium]
MVSGFSGSAPQGLLPIADSAQVRNAIDAPCMARITARSACGAGSRSYRRLVAAASVSRYFRLTASSSLLAGLPKPRGTVEDRCQGFTEYRGLSCVLVAAWWFVSSGAG